jgi:phage/plasmid-associated DNA primase
MDKEKYKHRLKEYLRQKGFDTSESPMRCFNREAHANGDIHPSCVINEDRFNCMAGACGIRGDIYEAVKILEGITDFKEQYAFLEKFFGDGYVFAPVKPAGKFTPDSEACKRFEAYLGALPEAEEKIRQFLDTRAPLSSKGKAESYPADILPDLIKQFYYWPGREIVLQSLGRDILSKVGIPGTNPKKGLSSWAPAGVIIKLGQGYKLHYYAGSRCEKINSKGANPFAVSLDKTKPLILTEGEIDAITVSAIGVENIIGVGGTEKVTAEQVKTYLLDFEEIVLLFDADSPGRESVGLEKTDRKPTAPENIIKAGYRGKIKIAEIPLDCACKDPDELILAGKQDILFQSIADAKEYVFSAKHTPKLEGGNLKQDLLRSILRKIPREDMEPADIPQFVGVCVKSFDHTEIRNLLEDWGASAEEIESETALDQRYLLEIAKKYKLSWFYKNKIEDSIILAGTPNLHIKINNTLFDIDLDILSLSRNAVGFIQDFNTYFAASAIRDIFAGRIVYDEADKNFYYFNGHIWEYLSDVAGLIYNTLIAVLHFFMRKEITELGGDKKEISEVEKYYLDKIRRIGNGKTRTGIRLELAGLNGINHNSANPDDPLKFDARENTKETLTLLDCVLDFSGEKVLIRESRPEEYRRKTLPYTRSQIEAGISCDKFHAFMGGNFKNKKTLEMFMFYLAIIPSQVQYKYGAFFIGGKDTGKSTTVKLIETLYGSLIGSMPSDILLPKGRVFSAGNGPTPYIADLQNRGAVIINEPEGNRHLDEGAFKQLTGNDKVSARRLNQAPIEFYSGAQIIIVVNIMPKFNHNDFAIIERILAVPFLQQHKRCDTDRKQPEDFIEELRPEFPAIIRLLAEYYTKLKYEKHMEIPESEEAKRYKKDRIDALKSDTDQYIEDYLVFDKDSITPTAEIYEDYKRRLELDEDSVKNKEGIGRYGFTQIFTRQHGIRSANARVNGNTQKCLFGVRLKTEEELNKYFAERESETEDEPAEENPFE